MTKLRKINIKTYKIPAGKVLVMKQVSPENKSHGGFVWPDSGHVECEHWLDNNECGYGLHGFLKGEGDGNLANYAPENIWKIVEVEEKAIRLIDGGQKVKFKSGEVIFSGPLKDAADIMKIFYPDAKVIGATATAGTRGTATAGDAGTATAGDAGTATAGYAGTATAGTRGTATAGTRGTATAGYAGVLIITYYDNKTSSYKRKIALVGEDKILPNVKYKLNDKYEFEEVK